MKRFLTTAITAVCLSTIVASASLAGSGRQGGQATFETFDADGDGRVTRAEMHDMAGRHLAKADADGDGAISRAELLLFATERAASRADRMMARLDANQDGMIGTDEMSGGMRTARRFDRFDTDGDGAISKAEFDAARARMARRGGPAD